jgi:hypothetical protein
MVDELTWISNRTKVLVIVESVATVIPVPLAPYMISMDIVLKWVGKLRVISKKQ